MRTETDYTKVKPKISGHLRGITAATTGNKIYISDSDFVYNTLTIRQATSDADEITVGAAIISSCNFTLWNDSGKFSGWDWTNSAIELYLEFGNETVYIGSFVIISHTESGNTIKVEALDWLKVFDSHELGECKMNWPIDAVDAVNTILTTGVKNMEVSGLDNAEGIMLTDPGDDSMTNRDALSYIAQCLGRFVISKTDDETKKVTLNFGWYDTANAYDAGTTFSHQLRTDSVKVTGVEVTTGDGKTTEKRGTTTGYVAIISDNPFISSKNIVAIADRIAASILGLEFRPGDFALLSNVRIEAGDAITISTREESNIITLATDVTYKPSQIKESVIAHAEEADGDLQIKKAAYVRRVINNELNNPNSDLSKAISGSGGEGGGRTPEEAYADTRPDDWLVMPEPRYDNDIYLLYSAYEGVYSPVLIYAYTSTKAESVKFEIGTSDETGAFVSNISQTVESDSSASSKNSVHTWEYNITEDLLSDVLSDGNRQCIIKISATSLTRLDVKAGSPYNGERYNVDIVEFCGAASLISDLDMPGSLLYFTLRGENSLQAISSTSSSSASLSTLRELLVVRELNTSNFAARGLSSAFSNCYALISVPKFDATNATDVSHMFSNCYNLEYFDGLENVSDGINMYNMFAFCRRLSTFPDNIGIEHASNVSNMFYNCESLKTIPDLNIDIATSASQMFYQCYNIETVGNISMKSCTSSAYMFKSCQNLETIGTIEAGSSIDMSGMFSNCINIKHSPAINFSSATSISSIFDGCSSMRAVEIDGISGSASINAQSFACSNLRSITFKNAETWQGGNITLTTSHLDTAAAVKLFESLPAISTAKYIKLSLSALTDEQKAIATDKGWTVS